PEVDHGKGGRLLGDGGDAGRHGAGGAHRKAAPRHGAFEAREEGRIVIDQQKAGIGGEEFFERVHGPSLCFCRPSVKAARIGQRTDRGQTMVTRAWPAGLALSKLRRAPVRSSRVLAMKMPSPSPPD